MILHNEVFVLVDTALHIPLVCQSIAANSSRSGWTYSSSLFSFMSIIILGEFYVTHE